MYTCDCGNVWHNLSRNPAACNGCGDCGKQYSQLPKGQKPLRGEHSWSNWNTMKDSPEKETRQCLICMKREVRDDPICLFRETIQ